MKPDPNELLRNPAIWRGLRLFSVAVNLGLVVFGAPLLLIGAAGLWFASGLHDPGPLIAAAIGLGGGGLLAFAGLRGIVKAWRAKGPPPDPVLRQAPAIPRGTVMKVPPQPGVALDRPVSSLVGGLLALGISLPILFLAELPELPKYTTGDRLPGFLIALLFLLVGLVLLGDAARHFAHIRRYGRLPLTVEPQPVFPGDTLRMSIPVRGQLPHMAQPRATVSCAKLRIHKRSKGGYVVHPTVYWSRTVPLRLEPSADGVTMVASVALPADQPASTPARDRKTDRIAWRIEVADGWDNEVASDVANDVANNVANKMGGFPMRGEYEIIVARPAD